MRLARKGPSKARMAALPCGQIALLQSQSVTNYVEKGPLP